jgi:copper chaperone CopZ
VTGGAADIRSVELAVSGMHCESCAALIEETLTDHPAVMGVSVRFGSALARVDYDPTATNVDELCQAVVAAGYGATVADSADSTITAGPSTVC